eukprot:SAG11_NODE_4159_length_2032_cov_5.648215_1_plen_294_part_00
MPYRRKQNKKLRRNNNQRYKKGFKKAGATRKLYHSSVPRTLQLATRRPNSVTLRFVKNLCYEVVPQSLSENIFLSIRANSIYDILPFNGSQNQPNTWIPQDSAYAPTAGLVVNAEGYDEWAGRFQHFHVLGSKLQATYEPIQSSVTSSQTHTDGTIVQAPTTLYTTLCGVTNQINTTTPMKAIIALPYCKRASLIASKNGLSGKRVYNFYSAKKFENVKDVVDNSQLRGRFQNSFGSASQTSEMSFYNLGIVSTTEQSLGQSTDKKPPAGLMRVKVEYIVKLSEPTNSNQVSL